MRIIVAGAGKVGKALAKQLQREKHDVAIIDSNEKVINELSNTMDVMGYVGNTASYSVLQEAGASACDLLIALTNSDEINMLTCLCAHKLGTKHTVARVRNPEYSQQLNDMKDDLGLSMVVNPEKATAEEIARMLRIPSAVKVETFAKGRAELVGCRIPEESVLAGMKLFEIPEKLGCRVLVCGVERQGKAIIPNGTFTLMPDDEIYFTGATREIEKAFVAAGMGAQPIKSVMIAGGGKISYYLASKLGGHGRTTKIIENDVKTAELLAESLPDTIILNGDAGDRELLMEEGLDNTDAFIGLTGLDEANILSCMYARRHQVRKIIAKVNSGHLTALAHSYGLDSIVSAREVTVNLITRYVRALDASSGSNDIRSLHRVAGGNIEVLEFRATEDAKELMDKPLKSIKIKENTIIACIVRKGVPIIPGGDDMIKFNDSVLVATAGVHCNRLIDIMEV